MAEVLIAALKRIEKYKETAPYFNELFDILGEILILREEYRDKMGKITFPIEERLIPQKLAGGLPLLDLAAGGFDLTLPEEYFLRLIEIAKKKFPEEMEMYKREINYEELLFSTFSRDERDGEEDEEMLEDMEDSFDLLGMLAEESLRPALEHFATRFRDAIQKYGWQEGYCPICGKEPKIGKITGAEGKRFLFCNQCGFEWNYDRIKCPFCGNEEQHSLAYFTIEGEEKYRVDVCNECNRYVKIVDVRKFPEEPSLDVEDIATLHLDILAAEEGYE